MSATNPKPLTPDEVADAIRLQFKVLKNKDSTQDEKNTATYTISVLSELYVKAFVN